MAVTKLADSNDITSRALLMDGLLHQLGAPALCSSFAS